MAAAQKLKATEMTEVKFDIYDDDASITTWTHSQHSTVATDVETLRTSSHRTSLKWSWRPSQSVHD